MKLASRRRTNSAPQTGGAGLQKEVANGSSRVCMSAVTAVRQDVSLPQMEVEPVLTREPGWWRGRRWRARIDISAKDTFCFPGNLLT